MDAQVTLALYHLAGPSPLLSGLVVAIAQYGLYVLPAVLAVAWLWPAPDAPSVRRAVLASLVSLAAAGVLVLVLGHLVERVRPFVALGLVPLFPHGVDSSFPSDHELATMALALPILLRRPRLGAWLAVWALLIGFARIAAGVHWPSDIVGSALLAAIPAAVGVALVDVALSRVALVQTVAAVFGLLDAPTGAAGGSPGVT